MQILRPYGASNAGERLNVVLDHLSFNNVGEFEAHLGELVGKFDSSEPHLFLFGEAPFPEKYVAKGRAVKDMVKRVSALLKEKHPGSAVAFSVFENSPGTNKRSYVANNGYLIHGRGHRFYPKVKLTEVDKAHGGLAYKDQAIWNEVADVRKRRLSFPTHVFRTGHEVMFKVCADAALGSSKPSRILAVSSNGFGQSSFLNIKNHEIGIMNDDLESFIVQGNTRISSAFGHENKEAARMLEKEKIRIHQVV